MGSYNTLSILRHHHQAAEGLQFQSRRQIHVHPGAREKAFIIVEFLREMRTKVEEGLQVLFCYELMSLNTRLTLGIKKDWILMIS
nr:succinate dehydrogenase subunit 7A, mitochondrial-like [Tanacetum cinerariifolium]